MHGGVFGDCLQFALEVQFRHDTLHRGDQFVVDGEGPQTFLVEFGSLSWVVAVTGLVHTKRRPDDSAVSKRGEEVACVRATVAGLRNHHCVVGT